MKKLSNSGKLTVPFLPWNFRIITIPFGYTRSQFTPNTLYTNRAEGKKNMLAEKLMLGELKTRVTVVISNHWLDFRGELRAMFENSVSRVKFSLRKGAELKRPIISHTTPNGTRTICSVDRNNVAFQSNPSVVLVPICYLKRCHD